MELKQIQVSKLKLADYNPRRISDKELKKLVVSIEENGFVQPIIVNKDLTIIGGHQRVRAAKQLNISSVPAIILDVTKEKEKELNLALNRISGNWEETALKELLEELEKDGRMYATGFEAKELDKLRLKEGNQLNRKLLQEYIVAPFSIFDTKQNYWTNRKKEWYDQLGDTIVKSEEEDEEGFNKYVDPVLIEVLLTWYASKGATVVDPFISNPITELVANKLGYVFSKKAKAEILITDPLDKNIENEKDYKDFLNTLQSKLKSVSLHTNAWAIIKTGNIRDKDGRYYNLVGDTINIMQNLGYTFHNEIILATPVGTATLKARRVMELTKQVTKTHQNILFFSKGKEVKINTTLKNLLISGQTATAHYDVLVFKK